MRAAEDRVRARRIALAKAAPWWRRSIAQSMREAGTKLDDARSRLDDARREAAPLTQIEVAEDRVHEAERDVRTARSLERLERMGAPDLTRPADHGIDLDGLGL